MRTFLKQPPLSHSIKSMVFMNKIAYRFQQLILNFSRVFEAIRLFLDGMETLFFDPTNFEIHKKITFNSKDPAHRLSYLLFYKFGVLSNLLYSSWSGFKPGTVWICRPLDQSESIVFILRFPVPLRLPNYLNHSFCKKKQFCLFLPLKM